jgi:hypothetical protein
MLTFNVVRVEFLIGLKTSAVIEILDMSIISCQKAHNIL